MAYWNCGHGHVYQSPSGQKARCGGPGICSLCARDLAHKTMAEGRKKITALKLAPWCKKKDESDD